MCNFYCRALASITKENPIKNLIWNEKKRGGISGSIRKWSKLSHIRLSSMGSHPELQINLKNLILTFTQQYVQHPWNPKVILENIPSVYSVLTSVLHWFVLFCFILLIYFSLLVFLHPRCLWYIVLGGSGRRRQEDHTVVYDIGYDGVFTCPTPNDRNVTILV